MGRQTEGRKDKRTDGQSNQINEIENVFLFRSCQFSDHNEFEVDSINYTPELLLERMRPRSRGLC